VSVSLPQPRNPLIFGYRQVNLTLKIHPRSKPEGGQSDQKKPAASETAVGTKRLLLPAESRLEGVSEAVCAMKRSGFRVGSNAERTGS
jgi:hypothetical protein